jgi:hypothetical protein
MELGVLRKILRKSVVKISCMAKRLVMASMSAKAWHSTSKGNTSCHVASCNRAASDLNWPLDALCQRVDAGLSLLVVVPPTDVVVDGLVMALADEDDAAAATGILVGLSVCVFPVAAVVLFLVVVLPTDFLSLDPSFSAVELLSFLSPTSSSCCAFVVAFMFSSFAFAIVFTVSLGEGAVEGSAVGAAFSFAVGVAIFWLVLASFLAASFSIGGSSSSSSSSLVSSMTSRFLCFFFFGWTTAVGARAAAAATEDGDFRFVGSTPSSPPPLKKASSKELCLVLLFRVAATGGLLAPPPKKAFNVL